MARSARKNGLYDPSHGDPPLHVQSVKFGPHVYEPERTNYFTVYRIQSGTGRFWADAAAHAFGPGSLLFFVPYQHIRFEPDGEVRGELIWFHANFLCIETFHAEVGCAGVLFNDPYGVPAVQLDDVTTREVNHLLQRMHQEQHECGLAHSEVLLAYLKVLLVLATRLKSPSDDACSTGMDHRHPVIASLASLVEQHYCTLHAPADYAKLLHMTPKTLGRIVREQLGKSLTDLIQARHADARQMATAAHATAGEGDRPRDRLSRRVVFQPALQEGYGLLTDVFSRVRDRNPRREQSVHVFGPCAHSAAGRAVRKLGHSRVLVAGRFRPCPAAPRAGRERHEHSQNLRVGRGHGSAGRAAHAFGADHRAGLDRRAEGRPI